jgi:dTDP-glucose 4,6-dehydratase
MLITGGAGFIGSNFVRYVLRRYPSCRPVVLDKMTYAGNWDNLADLADRITFIQGDIAEPADVAEAISGAQAVVNFAAESHVDRSLLNSHPFVRTNVEGTLVLLEAAVREGVRRFAHISTDEVYGDLSGTDAHSVETDMLAPRSPYAATKAAAEHLAFSYGISHGLDVVITRGSNTYGPYQYPEKIIPLFITNAIEGKPLPLYGDGTAVRDYMHVEDHCEGVDFILQNGSSGQAYNLGAGYEIPGLEVADKVLGLLGRPASLKTFVRDRPGHDYRYSVDTAKVEALGWRRRRAWEEGLAATVQWYLKNTAWWQAAKRRVEFRQHERRWYEQRGED